MPRGLTFLPPGVCCAKLPRSHNYIEDINNGISTFKLYLAEHKILECSCTYRCSDILTTFYL
jgi:hypothetical protein